MGLNQAKDSTNFFIDTESLTQALDAAGIPWKKSGSEINADVHGTGHYDHKCNPKKSVYLHSNGSSGTLYQLLKSIGQYDFVRNAPKSIPDTPQKKAYSAEDALQSAMSYPPDTFFNSKPYQMRSINHNYHPWVIVARYLDKRRLSLEMLPKSAKVKMYRSGDVDLMIPLYNGYPDKKTVHFTLLNKQSESRHVDYLDGGSRYAKGPMRSIYDGASHLIIQPVHKQETERNHSRYCIGEGLETTLTGVLLSGYPGIFGVNRGGLTLFLNDPRVIEKLRQQKAALFVLVDRDVSGDGQKSAHVLINKAEKHDIPAFYCLPPEIVKGKPKGADWNNALMEHGEETARRLFFESFSEEPIFAGNPENKEQKTHDTLIHAW